MKQTWFGPATAAALFLAMTCLDLVAPQAAADQKVHVVQKGDTLWDISTTYLYDPFLWPQVWNANRDIENPHLIYPGQEILIPMDVLRRPPAPSVARPALPPAPAGPEAGPAEEPETSVEEVKQEMIFALSTYGFIVEDEEIGLGTISDTSEERLLIRPGMKVYIRTPEDEPLADGGDYSIVRVFDKVVHPVTGRDMGYLAKVLGEVAIVDAREGLSTAMTGAIYREARVGDQVIESVDYLSWLPASGPGQPLNLEGYVILNPEGRTVLGRGDIVFTDLGSGDGLATGDLLNLVEKKKPVNGIQPPEEVVGRIQILVARPETSVARIVESLKNVSPGTKVISEAP